MITIMAAKYIFFVLLVSIIQRADSEKCFLKTESDVVKLACCADFEKKENDCIACPNGYTSEIGQHCRPCHNNTYGERCRYDCSCSVVEICDIIEGCVKLPTTTEKTAHETSDITTYLRDLDQSTSGKGTDRNISVKGVLTTEIIIILTLSGIVLVFGVCLCFIFYKYKSAAKEKKSPNNQLQIIPSPPHNDFAIEMEERLYDLIDESDMIDDHHVQQMQIASVYLDVIDESINTMSYESQNKVILNFPSQSIPTAEVKHQENKNDSSSSLGSDSTSPNDEDRQKTTEDYVNPYQPVLKMSPPKKEEYLTIPPLHKIDSNFHDTTGEKEKLLMHPQQLEVGASTRHFDYENMINFEQTYMYTNLSNIRKQISVSCKSLIIERPQTEMSSEQEVEVFNSTDDYRLHYYNMFKTKSETDIFCKHTFKK